MNKPHNNSVFAKLTPEQLETLEDWLFEEKMSYEAAIERVQKEFGVAASASAVGRLYRRLETERSRRNLEHAVVMCRDAKEVVKAPEMLQEGLLTLACKSAVELAVQSPERVKEFTALLRALTLAQAQEIKRRKFELEAEEGLKALRELQGEKGATMPQFASGLNSEKI